MITANILFNDEVFYLQNCIKSLGNQKSISCIQIITTSGIGRYYDYAKSIIKKVRYLDIFKDTDFRVVPYSFNKDFSLLRNFANNICQTEYILHLDCDERIVIPNDYEFFNNLNVHDKDLFLGDVFGWHTHINHPSKYYKYDCARLMKREVKWINEVHEVPDVINDRVLRVKSYKIAHLGYDISKSDMMDKIRRNIELLNSAVTMKDSIRKMYLNLTANILNA